MVTWERGGRGEGEEGEVGKGMKSEHSTSTPGTQSSCKPSVVSTHTLSLFPPTTHLLPFDQSELPRAGRIDLYRFFPFADPSETADDPARHTGPSYVDAVVSILCRALSLSVTGRVSGRRSSTTSSSSRRGEADDEGLRSHAPRHELAVDGEGQVDEACLQRLEPDDSLLWHGWG